jgi:hypothetical protein
MEDHHHVESVLHSAKHQYCLIPCGFICCYYRLICINYLDIAHQFMVALANSLTYNMCYMKNTTQFHVDSRYEGLIDLLCYLVGLLVILQL